MKPMGNTTRTLLTLLTIVCLVPVVKPIGRAWAVVGSSSAFGNPRRWIWDGIAAPNAWTM